MRNMLCNVNTIKARRLVRAGEASLNGPYSSHTTAAGVGVVISRLASGVVPAALSNEGVSC